MAGKQKKLRTLLNKGVAFWVDDEMREELERSKRPLLTTSSSTTSV